MTVVETNVAGSARLRKVFAAAVVAVVVALGSAPAAQADEVSCTGALTGTVNANVVVPHGATCEITNARVNGNVITNPMSRLDVLESRIKGNVECASGPLTQTSERWCDLLDGTVVRGSAIAVRGGVLHNHGAHVVGNMKGGPGSEIAITPSLMSGNPPPPSAPRGRVGGNLVCDGCVFADSGRAIIGGAIQIKNASAGSFIFDGNEIAGDVEVLDSAAGEFAFELDGNTIGGNVKYERNRGPINILNNTIRGNLQFFANREGPFDISENRIGGNLQCEENVPPPAGGGNVASTKEGQCRAL